MRLNWRAASLYATGYVTASLWLFVPPSADPWIRIPGALLTAVIMLPIGAWLWGWVFSETPR